MSCAGFSGDKLESFCQYVSRMTEAHSFSFYQIQLTCTLSGGPEFPLSQSIQPREKCITLCNSVCKIIFGQCHAQGFLESLKSSGRGEL